MYSGLTAMTENLAEANCYIGLLLPGLE